MFNVVSDLSKCHKKANCGGFKQQASQIQMIPMLSLRRVNKYYSLLSCSWKWYEVIQFVQSTQAMLFSIVEISVTQL